VGGTSRTSGRLRLIKGMQSRHPVEPARRSLNRYWRTRKALSRSLTPVAPRPRSAMAARDAGS
jgi:hypothetical protein